jgi:hypothetical protein
VILVLGMVLTPRAEDPDTSDVYDDPPPLVASRIELLINGPPSSPPGEPRWARPQCRRDTVRTRITAAVRVSTPSFS